MKLSRPITDKSLHDPAVEKGKQLQRQPGSWTAVHPPTYSFALLCLHDIRFSIKQAHPVVRTVRHSRLVMPQLICLIVALVLRVE